MTKKDLLNLLASNLFFVFIAVGAFYYSNELRSTNIELDQQKLKKFIANVESGKWELTTEQWIKYVRLSNSTAQSHSRVDIHMAELICSLGRYTVIGMLLQMVMILCLFKKLKNQNIERIAPVTAA